jgi:hypothetical protein
MMKEHAMTQEMVFVAIFITIARSHRDDTCLSREGKHHDHADSYL